MESVKVLTQNFIGNFTITITLHTVADTINGYLNALTIIDT